MLACVPAGLRPIAQSPLGPPEHSSIAGRHVIELCTGVCSVWRGVGGVLDPRCRIDRTPRPSHRPAGPGSCPCLVVARGRGLRKPANSNAQSQRRLYSSGSRLRAVYGTYTVCVPVALPDASMPVRVPWYHVHLTCDMVVFRFSTLINNIEKSPQCVARPHARGAPHITSGWAMADSMSILHVLYVHRDTRARSTACRKRVSMPLPIHATCHTHSSSVMSSRPRLG